jgi:hypothetical protein
LNDNSRTKTKKPFGDGSKWLFIKEIENGGYISKAAGEITPRRKLTKYRRF